MTDRYNHKYVAFIDGLYIEELCDTDNIEEFTQICIEYGKSNGFRAFIDDKEIEW